MHWIWKPIAGIAGDGFLEITERTSIFVSFGLSDSAWS